MLFRLSALSGQINNISETYLYLYNDSLIKFKNLEVKLTPTGIPYFQTDNSKIELDNVKFYKDFTGFYANAKNYYPSYLPLFAKQICHGKINTYQFTQELTTRPMRYYNDQMHYNLLYYNKGFDDLKKINYRNLKVDLTDNPDALKHLNNYELCKISQTGFALAGQFSIVDGIIISVKQTSKDQKVFEKEFMAGKKSVNDNPGVRLNPFFIGLGGGIGFFVIAGEFSIFKHKQLKKAIDTFNQ